MGTVFIASNDQIIKKDSEVLAKEREYINYIIEHINNVYNVYETLFEDGKRYLPTGITEEEYNNAIENIKQEVKEHDKSKFGEEEFDAYRINFYPTKKEKEKMDSDIDFFNEVKNNFQNAFKHHYTVNDHHPQHFIIDKEITDMPLECIIHMICDWCAMSLKFENKLSPVEWYNTKAKDEKASMSTKTKQIVDEMLFLIFNEEII